MFYSLKTHGIQNLMSSLSLEELFSSEDEKEKLFFSITSAVNCHENSLIIEISLDPRRKKFALIPQRMTKLNENWIRCERSDTKTFSLFQFLPFFAACHKPVSKQIFQESLPSKANERVQVKELWKIAEIFYGKIDMKKERVGRFPPKVCSFPLFLSLFLTLRLSVSKHDSRQPLRRVDWEIILRKISIGRGGKRIKENEIEWKRKKYRKLHEIIMQDNEKKRIRVATKSEKLMRREGALEGVTSYWEGISCISDWICL